ncbi:MAG TPA: hypothetical protein VGD73_11550 [Pseudonocardia sp.]|jgi:hypothetical protein|uniref:hypothetical protein n=1 Tax=Pseudonocardia sp. TaxID=60912 RepID=UPI002ED7D236
MGSAGDAVWIDVSMWSGLSGKPQPFTEIKCDPPEVAPTGVDDWRDWALAQLEQIAAQDDWQPGRYHFTVEQRDPSGRPLDAYAHGIWEWLD